MSSRGDSYPFCGGGLGQRPGPKPTATMPYEIEKHTGPLRCSADKVCIHIPCRSTPASPKMKSAGNRSRFDLTQHSIRKTSCSNRIMTPHSSPSTSFRHVTSEARYIRVESAIRNFKFSFKQARILVQGEKWWQ
jgi:hypothetical protein